MKNFDTDNADASDHRNTDFQSVRPAELHSAAFGGKRTGYPLGARAGCLCSDRAFGYCFRDEKNFLNADKPATAQFPLFRRRIG